MINSNFFLTLFLIFLYHSFCFSEIIRIELNDRKLENVDIEFFEKVAPDHVKRVKKLVIEGKYNGVVFHRVIEGFMAQTGDIKFGNIDSLDMQNVGRGGSEYSDLNEEFSSIKFEKGIVGMARSKDINSANSQFFIMYDRAPWLDTKYTVWGKVISGMESLQMIKKGSKNNNGKVIEPSYIKRIYIVQ